MTSWKAAAGAASMMVLAPLLRMQQHPFDNLSINVMRFQIFDGADGIKARLHLNALIDDIAAHLVEALAIRFRIDGGKKSLQSRCVHLPSFTRLGRYRRIRSIGREPGVHSNEYQRIYGKVNVSFLSPSQFISLYFHQHRTPFCARSNFLQLRRPVVAGTGGGCSPARYNLLIDKAARRQ